MMYRLFYADIHIIHYNYYSFYRQRQTLISHCINTETLMFAQTLQSYAYLACHNNQTVVILDERHFQRCTITRAVTIIVIIIIIIKFLNGSQRKED